MESLVVPGGVVVRWCGGVVVWWCVVWWCGGVVVWWCVCGKCQTQQTILCIQYFIDLDQLLHLGPTKYILTSD
jgi:hypothetical protein